MRPSTLAGLLTAVALLGIPTVARAQEKPFAALSKTLLAGRDSLVHLARQQVGLRYRLGAVRPGLAFDCSGLVKWVLAALDFELPRTAAQQAKLGVAVPKDTAQLLPGDLLFFGRGRRVTHIGIYVGAGKYVHAANRRKGVIESDITQAAPTWWKGARRLLLDADTLIGGFRIQN
ncbi:MAG TPA: C40 family peptidase [Gemmatimonadales bacterium]|jgi:cell wall-associated NlpC family hydrolase|nr:C40 family peptidase [Gemmatimonadales bacterium]